ncbi:hypothetical protein NECAME_12093 [Necator americanus]|uniref:Uncharacterized protein n=1 Tax=Necator americanus TaxID=51031 RepID=W2T2N8_NECAM|nr:hypothetical protein NECAME_12093 [Necator americanus]ETN75814.1 hypothetical protein NECAME_12093 [Necator americanus]
MITSTVSTLIKSVVKQLEQDKLSVREYFLLSTKISATSAITWCFDQASPNPSTPMELCKAIIGEGLPNILRKAPGLSQIHFDVSLLIFALKMI